MTIIPNILDHIGFWSPAVLVLIGLIEINDTMWMKPIFLTLVVFNIIINKGLKSLIQQERPYDSQLLYDFEDYSDEEQYGMPSGHAELSAFSVVYIYLMTRSKKWLLGGIFLTFLTCIQRWRFNLHSIPQLFIGLIVGTLMGIGLHKGTKEYLKTLYN